MSTGGKICSSLEMPQTLHADSVTSAPDDMIIAPRWGDRAQGPSPYNWGHPDWHSLHRAWSQVQAGECSLVFSLRAGNRRGTQSCAVSTLGRTGAPSLVLSCPARALAGRVDSGNVLECVSEWDQRHEFMANPVSWGPWHWGEEGGATVESVPSPVWPEPLRPLTMFKGSLLIFSDLNRLGLVWIYANMFLCWVH